MEDLITAKIKDLCQAVYGRYPSTIKPYSARVGAASVTKTLGDLTFSETAFFGTIVGQLGADAATIDTLTCSVGGVNGVVWTGEVNAGYTGPKVLPIASPEFLFNYLAVVNATAAIRASVIFQGYMLRFDN